MNFLNVDLLTMTVYIAIGLLIFLIVYFAEKNSGYVDLNGIKVKKYYLVGKIAYIILFMILVFIASFRYVDIGFGGSDAQTYVDIFKNSTTFEFELSKIVTLKQQEPLFYGMTYIMRIITSNHIIYFLLIYSIIVYGFLKFISSNFDKTMIIFPVILVVVNYIYSFSAIRSSMALSLGILALNSYQQGRKKSALTLILISSMFHYTAIIILVFFIFYEILNKNILKNKITVLFSLLLFTVCMYLLIDVMDSFLSTTKYRVYSENSNNFKGQLPTIVFAFIVFIYHKSLVKLMRNKQIYIYFIYFNIVLIPAIMFLGAYRFSAYFELPKLVVMSYLIKNIGEKHFQNNKWGKLILYYVSFVIIFFWMIYMIIRTSDSANLMPYINILLK